MKRTYGLQAGVMVALGALITSCEQPKIHCTTGHGDFAVTYTLKPGSKRGEGDCDKLRAGIIGLEKYNPSKPGNREEQDLSRALLAIRAPEIGDIVALARKAVTPVDIDSSAANSLGDFTSVDPDENNICAVPSLSAAELKVPEFQYEISGDPPETGTQPATEIRYEWSNVRVFVTPEHPGTLMAADLEYTKDGCSASYSVVGVWPVASCDADGDEGDAVDVALCDSRAEEQADDGIPGSGLNPDLDGQITCEPTTALCVLKAPPRELQ